MRHPKKRIALILAAILMLSALLFGCGKQNSVDYDAYQQKMSELQAQIVDLQSRIDEPLAELTPKPVTVISLSGAYASVYTYVYPLLQKAGMPAVVALEDGRMPGEEGMITLDQAKELISAGWEFALGDSTDIPILDESGENPTGQWLAYLDDCLSTMRNLGLPAPITFCFGQDRYHPAAEQALSDRGIRVVRHSFDDMDAAAVNIREELYAGYGIEMYGRNLSDSGLIYRVGGALVRTSNSTAQLNVETAIKQKAVVSISVGQVLPSVTDRDKDCTLEKFTSMVNVLLEYERDNGLEIMTFSGMYAYKSEFEADLDSRTAEYEEQSAKLQAEIDRIKEEIQEMMKEMMGQS